MDDPMRETKDEAAEKFKAALLEYFAGLQQRLVEAVKNGN